MHGYTCMLSQKLLSQWSFIFLWNIHLEEQIISLQLYFNIFESSWTGSLSVKPSREQNMYVCNPPPVSLPGVHKK